MKHRFASLALSAAVLAGVSAASAAEAPAPFGPTPSPVQVSWHALGYYGFCHFTVNTFTGREWGNGDEDPNVFNPSDLDAHQIVRAFKAGGMKGVILTAKHHDGFCLWPSAYTDHSVKFSKWKDGKGDIVRAFADACRDEGMLFGVYLSPWDRNRADYARPEYLTYYRNQLRELCSNYGPLFCVWLDGANGGTGYYGGANEKRTIPADYYDWPNTIKIIRDLQPHAAINSGNDFRWIGNEKGQTPETCWSTVGNGATGAGPERKTLGSGAFGGSRWCGAETDVSITAPHWYFHEKDVPKTPAQLVDIWFGAVGRGQCLNLNMAPDTRGHIPDADVTAVTAMNDALQATFATNLAAGAKLTPSNVRGNDPAFDASQLTAPGGHYWATDDDVHTPTLTVDFAKPTPFDVIRFGEYIPLGQRIQAVTVEAHVADAWKPIATATSIGYQRLIRLKAPVTADQLRLTVTQCPAAVTLTDVGVFKQPTTP
jgi:alpha-L-fucosidase